MYPVVPSYCIHVIYFLSILATTKSPFPPPAPSTHFARPAHASIPPGMASPLTPQATEREENNQAGERNNQSRRLEPPPPRQKVWQKGVSYQQANELHVGSPFFSTWIYGHLHS